MGLYFKLSNVSKKNIDKNYYAVVFVDFYFEDKVWYHTVIGNDIEQEETRNDTNEYCNRNWRKTWKLDNVPEILFQSHITKDLETVSISIKCVTSWIYECV